LYVAHDFCTLALGMVARRRTAAPDRSLRGCLGRFATGVAVVSFDAEHGRHGITVNSFTSVSIEPPLILVSVARDARSHDLLRDRCFCVNVLGAEQEAIARRFAGGAETELAWLEGEHAPRLAGVLAHLECTPWRAYDGGDHTLFLGEVAGFDYRDGDALAYHTSRFHTIAEPELGIEHLI
jgi:flavin reductase